ncbi:MAG: H-X9-DG-CTERM domain-containing protein [Phycisphaerales bacterium]
MSASSRHVGGVNVLMGDASGTFVSETIDQETWRALGTNGAGDRVAQP